MTTLQDIQSAVIEYVSANWKFEIEADTKLMDGVISAVEYAMQSGEVFFNE